MLFWLTGLRAERVFSVMSAPGSRVDLYDAVTVRFADGASDFLFGLLRAGKVAWAASVLYTLTGERKYRDMAVRIGDNIIAAQADEGYWCSVDETTPSNDTTAEMVVWLDEVHQAVGHD